MKRLIVLGVVVLSAIVSAQQPAAPPPTAPAAPATDKDRLSYAIGMNIGRQLKSQSVDVDPATFAQGFRDAYGGAKTALTEDEARAVMTAFEKEMRSKQAAAMAQTADKNLKEGEAFLAANKTKDGVVALPSGLQYKIVKEGTGPRPTLDDTVLCHYKGTLINGTEFDSSFKRNEPAKFPVKGVIRGWTEALQLMPVGSTWQLFVPSILAYGERGAGGVIGPNATLIFEVQLLSIQPKQ